MYVFVGAAWNDYSTVGYSTLIKEEKTIAIHEREVVICGARRYVSQHVLFHSPSPSAHLPLPIQLGSL